MRNVPFTGDGFLLPSVVRRRDRARSILWVEPSFRAGSYVTFSRDARPVESHDSQTSRTPEDHLRDQWRAEGQRMRLWAARGHNCICTDSTLGLWMHRCTVAEQCDLIATACATSTFVVHRKGKGTRGPPAFQRVEVHRNRNVTLRRFVVTTSRRRFNPSRSSYEEPRQIHR